MYYLAGKRPRHIVTFVVRRRKAKAITHSHFREPRGLDQIAGRHLKTQIQIKNDFRNIEHAKLILEDLNKLRNQSKIDAELKAIHPKELKLLEWYSRQSITKTEIHNVILKSAKRYFDTIDWT